MHATTGPIELLEPGTVYLTLDDGPHPRHTIEVLELLAAHGAAATFFVVGELAEAFPDVTRAIAAAGSVVGNHTWDHTVEVRSPGNEDEYLDQVARTSDAIERLLGTRPALFRPPWGAESSTSRASVRDLGLTTWKWQVSVHDWPPQTLAVDDMVRVVDASLFGGAQVVLFHDGLAPVLPEKAAEVDRTPTVEAVRALLPKLADTYNLRPLPASGAASRH